MWRSWIWKIFSVKNWSHHRISILVYEHELFNPKNISNKSSDELFSSKSEPLCCLLCNFWVFLIGLVIFCFFNDGSYLHSKFSKEHQIENRFDHVLSKKERTCVYNYYMYFDSNPYCKWKFKIWLKFNYLNFIVKLNF